MPGENKQSYYEILDVSLNANSEVIRTAYIRAKNSYNRDALASYSLFDQDESKRILEEIEEAYSVLSDSEKRRKYDESHGIITSESIYTSYHKGNHAVAAFARSNLDASSGESFGFEEDPFRKLTERNESPPPPLLKE
jgi:DnaJ-class molecular chaperone